MGGGHEPADIRCLVEKNDRETAVTACESLSSCLWEEVEVL